VCVGRTRESRPTFCWGRTLKATQVAGERDREREFRPADSTRGSFVIRLRRTAGRTVAPTPDEREAGAGAGVVSDLAHAGGPFLTSSALPGAGPFMAPLGPALGRRSRRGPSEKHAAASGTMIVRQCQKRRTVVRCGTKANSRSLNWNGHSEKRAEGAGSAPRQAEGRGAGRDAAKK
jgi:hypothetical protein